jgi:hypothetical protein
VAGARFNPGGKCRDDALPEKLAAGSARRMRAAGTSVILQTVL